MILAYFPDADKLHEIPLRRTPEKDSNPIARDERPISFRLADQLISKRVESLLVIEEIWLHPPEERTLIVRRFRWRRDENIDSRTEM